MNYHRFGLNDVLLTDRNGLNRGFFSALNLILLTLLYCEQESLNPIISKSVLSLYGSEVNGITPFAEYFENIYSGETKKDVKSLEIDWVHNNNIYDINDDKIKSRLRNINANLLAYMRIHLSGFIKSSPDNWGQVAPNVSIHYRGCDYLKNTPKAHVGNYPPRMFLEKIQYYIESNSLFVATDDNSFIGHLSMIKKNFCYFSDVNRRPPGQGVHELSFVEKYIYQSGRSKVSQKRKACEVFRDCYWLSKCDLYIGSNSNLMYYSSLLNINQRQINIVTPPQTGHM